MLFRSPRVVASSPCSSTATDAPACGLVNAANGTPSPWAFKDKAGNTSFAQGEFVEAGITGGPALIGVAHEYLDPLHDAGVDTLVLGCTHYPLLTGVIAYVMGDDVTLVSSAEETAKDVYRTLAAHDLLRPDDLPEPTHVFLATGDPADFQRLGRRFLGPEIGQVRALHA